MLKSTFGRAFLRLYGWRVEDTYPHEQKKLVIIAAPHTTNWDFPITLAVAWKLGIPMKFFGKHTLFRFPYGGLVRAVGGIPVDRAHRSNLVDALAEELDSRDELALVVPVEGTRSRGELWKSGFYHIARKANVPILPAFLDYEKKLGGFGAMLVPTGDVRADMDVLRTFYADKVGKFPANFTPPRLAEELA
jgi:1-acyl-sn-glycerol-3-phosphate acyltransferase